MTSNAPTDAGKHVMSNNAQCALPQINRQFSPLIGQTVL